MNLLEILKTNPSLKSKVEDIINTHKISLDSPWHDYEVLNIALKEQNVEVANHLLDIGCSVNTYFKPTKPSDTPLHRAIKSQEHPIVKKLLEKGASIVAIDSDANTSLHLAFMLKNYEIVDLMLRRMNQTLLLDDIVNKDNLTHLHIACARGNAHLVYRFNFIGANVHRSVSNTCQEYSGYTCLNFACDSKCLVTIENVLKATYPKEYNLDTKENDFCRTRCGPTFGIFKVEHEFDKFQDACYEARIDKVQSFLEQGKDVNAMARDTKGARMFTNLHLAVQASKNRQKVVELLLGHGANVNLKNGLCMTALHCAFYNDNFRKPKENLDEDMDPEQDDTLKIIYEAVKDKESNPMDAFGLTYFHIAVALNDMKMVNKFIEMGQADCKPISPNLRNFSKYSPLHFAVKYGHEDMAKLLIEQGADVKANETENKFDTPLQLAIKYGQCKMIDLLLNRGASAKIVSHCANTTLHLLVERFGDYKDEKLELLRLMDTFVKLGVEINAKDSKSMTALHQAAWRGQEEMVKALVERGAEILDDHGTYLHKAIMFRHLRVIRLLYEHGADVNYGVLFRLVERVSSTKMDNPEEKNLLIDFIEKLVNRGADANYNLVYTYNRYTPLHIACQSPNLNCRLIEKLLHVGADINLKCDSGKTALSYIGEERFKGNERAIHVLFDHIFKLTDLGLEINAENGEHFQRMGKYIDSQNSESCYDLISVLALALAEKKRQRLEEIEKLKADMLTNGVSMYDYIKMNGEQAATYVGNEKLQQIIEGDEIQSSYKIYGYLIRVVYRKGKQWLSRSIDKKGIKRERSSDLESD